MSNKQMYEEAKSVMQYAYAPYSNFHVGVCVRTDDDQLFVGCNVENVSFSLTLCAESSVIGALISAGKRRLVEVAIVSSSDLLCSPCGACRQRLREFADPKTPIHLYNDRGECKTVILDELLPHPFIAEHLERT